MKLLSVLNEDQTQQLDEHLGNLDSIDKELIKALFTSYDVKSQVQDIGFRPKKYGNPGQEEWHTGEPRKVRKVRKHLGRDSELANEELSFEDAADKFNTAGVAGLIYKHNGKQQLIIVLRNAAESGTNASTPTYYKSTLEFEWRSTSEFVRELHATPFPGTKKTFESEFDKLMKYKKDATDKRVGTVTELAKVKELLRLLAQLEWALANPTAKTMVKETEFPKLELTVIKLDKARTEVHAARKELKKGIVPIPRTPVHAKLPSSKYLSTSHNVYIQDLVQLMKGKANALRNKRSPIFENPEEMLKYVIEQGYIKKMQYMGQAYNLSDNRISLQDLLLGEKGRGESYVEYKAERTSSYSDENFKAAYEEYKQMVAEFKEHKHTSLPGYIAALDDEEKRAKAEQEFRDSWAYEQASKKMPAVYLRHKVHPSTLKISLVMDGGKIVPHDIKMDFRSL